MKRLRHILYLTEPDIALKVEGQALCAVRGDGQKERIPFHLLEGIVSFSYAGVTPAVLTACARRGIGFAALTPSGSVRFQVIGETRGNVFLRMRQYALPGQEEALPIMRAMLSGKFQNCRKVLERFRRNHPEQPVARLEQGCRRLREEEEQLALATQPGQLRGLEGAAAKAYFRSFHAMILPDGEAFSCSERSRRPPRDRCNALLSFAYTLLASGKGMRPGAGDCGAGPLRGYPARRSPGEARIGLDLMEELRPLTADRFVLRFINRKGIAPEQFEDGPEDGVYLTAEGRKCFLQAWNQWREVPVHLWGGERKCRWDCCPMFRQISWRQSCGGNGLPFCRCAGRGEAEC